MATTMGELERAVLDAGAKAAAAKADREKAADALRQAEAAIEAAEQERADAASAFGAALKPAGKVYVANGRVYWTDAAGKLVSDVHLTPDSPAAAPAGEKAQP